ARMAQRLHHLGAGRQVPVRLFDDFRRRARGRAPPVLRRHHPREAEPLRELSGERLRQVLGHGPLQTFPLSGRGPAGLSRSMVVHLNLSEGNQGKRLRSLRQVGNHDLATIYHELFHAYFDYVDFASGTPRMTPQGARLYAEAKRFAACRYAVVEVSPISAQQNAPRRGRYEKRRITERESWDALNETWGVFVGWAIWNKLETTDQVNASTRRAWDTVEEYLDRLETAYVNGELTGYFEPADQAERRGIPRWYLAPSHAISAPEVALLLEVILDETPGMARLAAYWVSASQDQTTVLTSGAC